MSLQRAMYRGDDRSFEFTLTADDEPIDLTGASIVFSGRTKADFHVDEVAPLILTSDAGDIVIDPDQAGYGMGVVTLNIPAAATIDFTTPLTLLCDFEVTDTYGLVRTWPDAAYGESTLIRLRIRGDATHP